MSDDNDNNNNDDGNGIGNFRLIILDDEKNKREEKRSEEFYDDASELNDEDREMYNELYNMSELEYILDVLGRQKKLYDLSLRRIEALQFMTVSFILLQTIIVMWYLLTV